MSKGADSKTQVCENSLTTLEIENNPEELPPRTISYTTRRPRFGTRNVPLSPYILIDGKKLRSSLALTKKKHPRRVNFPANDNLLVTRYLEPTNPWKFAENVNREDLISAYKESCKKHNTDPLEIVIRQLEVLDTSTKYSGEFNLKGQTLDLNICESLEEIFKRIQFNKVNLEATSLNDETSVILFDTLEYYESAKQLNISYNPGIEVQGWQACADMIRKTQCLEHLEAKGVILQEQYMNILSRTLRLVCHLHVLKLENCGLSGRSIAMLVAALKMNTGIRELYLADNGLNLYDAIQLGSLLRFNNHIQLLDISNNNIQDDGVRDILEGLINQINEDKGGKGLSILVLWNNQLTSKSSPYFARIIALSKTIETLNIGKNMLTNELLFIIKDALEKNHVLLQLGMQSIDLTCDGILTLSEIIEINQVLQRIDLRNNNIQMTGMRALSSAMKKNRSITKIDLDDKPTLKVDDLTEALHQYTQLVAEIQACCSENEQNRITEENSKGSESSHHSSLCSTNSRKISLTCHTLPCCLPTMISIQNDKSGQSMLEPKRINGGHLCSPALSPNSSPITSPIPSPSRSRFVVSRVPETSTCSTDSLASLSPSIALPLESSSTHLISSASGSSRFRVSLVESANIMPLPKSVVASSKIDVTTSSNFKLNITESMDSDDSGNIHRSKLEMNNDQNIENFRMSNNITSLISNVIEETPSTCEFDDVEELSSDRRSTKAVKTQFSDSINSTTTENKEYCDVQNNQVNIPTRLESIPLVKNIENVENDCVEDTKNIKTFLNTNKGDNRSNCTIVSDKSITNFINDNKKHVVTRNLTNTLLNERTDLQYQADKNYTQEHYFNSDKMFTLFQHPNCIFSDSKSISGLQSRCTFQDSVSIGMTRENRFHYYLQENRDSIHDHGTLEYSAPVKNKLTKSFAIFQLFSVKSSANMSLSFKFMANLNVRRQTNKLYPNTVIDVSLLLKQNRNNDLINIKEKCTDHSNENKQFQVDIKKEIDVSHLGHQLLAQDIQAESCVRLINKYLILMTNDTVSNMIVSSSYKLVNDILLIHVSERNMPLFKFLNIHEYFTLKVNKNYMKNKSIKEIIKNIDIILVKRTCDKTFTNSINFISDSSPLFYGAMYDIIYVNHMHNVLLLNLNMKSDVQNNFVLNTDNKQNNLAYLTYNEECDCNIVMNHINNKVTRMYNTDDNNNGRNAITYICNMWRIEIERIYIHSDLYDLLSLNSVGWRNTIVNNISEIGTSKMNFMHKDINFELSDDSTDLCTSVVYNKDVTNISRIQEIVKIFVTEDNKYFEESNIKKTKINDPFMENTMDRTVENTDITSIPRSYSYMTVFKQSVLRDVIFSKAGTSIDRILNKGKVLSEIFPNNSSDNAIIIKTSFYNLPQMPHSSIYLIIKKPENIHRNGEVSKPGNKNFPLNYNIQKRMHLHAKRKFQNDCHSGINSEYFSVCAKAYSIVHSKKYLCFLEKNNALSDNTSENIWILTKFGANNAQHVKYTTPDTVSDVTYKYFNTLKYAVATTICSKTAVNRRDNMTVEIISDESTNVAAPSSVIHKASTK